MFIFCRSLLRHSKDGIESGEMESDLTDIYLSGVANSLFSEVEYSEICWIAFEREKGE